MIHLPKAAEPLLNGFSLAFTARTFDRWLRLCVAAIMAIGPRTVTNLIWSARVPSPREVVQTARARSATVDWYGGGTRSVKRISRPLPMLWRMYECSSGRKQSCATPLKTRMPK